MSAQEIQKIEQNIKDKREQLARERDALVVCEIGDQARIKQRIRMKKEEIRDFEQEKWQIIAGMVANWRISDDEAQQIVTETVIEVQAVSGQTHDVPSTEILELLQEILAKLPVIRLMYLRAKNPINTQGILTVSSKSNLKISSAEFTSLMLFLSLLIVENQVTSWLQVIRGWEKVQS